MEKELARLTSGRTKIKTMRLPVILVDELLKGFAMTHPTQRQNLTEAVKFFSAIGLILKTGRPLPQSRKKDNPVENGPAGSSGETGN